MTRIEALTMLLSLATNHAFSVDPSLSWSEWQPNDYWCGWDCDDDGETGDENYGCLRQGKLLDEDESYSRCRPLCQFSLGSVPSIGISHIFKVSDLTLKLQPTPPRGQPQRRSQRAALSCQVELLLLNHFGFSALLKYVYSLWW